MDADAPGELGDLLSAIRRGAGLSQSALAELLGIDRAAISRRESGQRGLPAGELEHLAAALGVRIEIGPDGWRLVPPPDPFPPNPNRDDSHTSEGPGEGLGVLGAVAAGHGAFTGEHVDEWIDVGRRWLNRVDGLLEVHGDSMEPLLYHGDWIGFRLYHGEHPRVGDVVVAHPPDSDEAIVKVWGGLTESAHMILFSLNPEYLPLVEDPNALVVRGQAWGLVRLDPLHVTFRVQDTATGRRKRRRRAPPDDPPPPSTED